MPLFTPPSPEKPQSCELPALRATISDSAELGRWRENLYRSMTTRSPNAISRFLEEGLQVMEMMQILNKCTDRKRKSKWATLQTIIRYRKWYFHNADITADDVRAELESIDRDFSSQRTVADIIHDIREHASAAQIAEDAKLLTITIAGFEMPIIWPVREAIIALLQESRNTKETPIPEKLSPEKPTERPIAPQKTRAAFTTNTFRWLPPRTGNFAAFYRREVEAIRILREWSQTPHLNGAIPSWTHDERPHHEMQHDHPVHKPTAEIIIEHREFVKNHREIIQKVWKTSSRNGQHNSLLFENILRGKDGEVLTTLQAIRRLWRHKNWESVLKYVFVTTFSHLHLLNNSQFIPNQMCPLHLQKVLPHLLLYPPSPPLKLLLQRRSHYHRSLKLYQNLQITTPSFCKSWRVKNGWHFYSHSADCIQGDSMLSFILSGVHFKKMKQMRCR